MRASTEESCPNMSDDEKAYQELNSDNDISNKKRLDCSSSDENTEPDKSKRKRRPSKASNFQKMLDVLVVNNKKRENEKIENKAMKQKRHEDKLNQSQQLLDILKVAFTTNRQEEPLQEQTNR